MITLHIRKVGKKYNLYSRKTGKLLGSASQPKSRHETGDRHSNCQTSPRIMQHLNPHLIALLQFHLSIDQRDLEMLLNSLQKEKSCEEFFLLCYELQEICNRIKKVEQQLAALSIE